MKALVIGLAAGLVLAAVPARAEELDPSTSYEYWRAGTFRSSGSAVAGTVNDSYSMLARYCQSDGRCHWRLAIVKLGGTQGNRYPGMISSPRGAGPIEVRCIGPAKDYERTWYSFEDEDVVVDALASGTGEVVFTFPTASGRMMTITFKIDGALAALTELNRLRPAQSRPSSPSRQGTKDTLL